MSLLRRELGVDPSNLSDLWHVAKVDLERLDIRDTYVYKFFQRRDETRRPKPLKLRGCANVTDVLDRLQMRLHPDIRDQVGILDKVAG